MTNFACTPTCSRIMLTVATETMRLFHGANEFIFKNKTSLHFLSPKEQCCNVVNYKKRKLKQKNNRHRLPLGGGVTLPHTIGNFPSNILFKHIVFYLIIILRYCFSVKYNSKKDICSEKISKQEHQANFPLISAYYKNYVG